MRIYYGEEYDNEMYWHHHHRRSHGVSKGISPQSAAPLL